MIDSNQVCGHSNKKYQSTPLVEKDILKTVEWMNPQLSWRVLVLDSDLDNVINFIAPKVGEAIIYDKTKKWEDKIHHFDAIICRMSSHLLKNSYLFSGLTRVLKNDGKFMFIDYVLPSNSSNAEFLNKLFHDRDNEVGYRPTVEWKTLFKKYRLYVHSALLEKKQLYFNEWVNNHFIHETKIRQMEKLLLDATPRQKQYFSIDTESDRVISFKVDLWMALFEKNIK